MKWKSQCNTQTHTHSFTHKNTVDRYISVIGVVKNAISRTFDLPMSIKLLGSLYRSLLFLSGRAGIFRHKSVMCFQRRKKNFPLLSNDVGEKSFSVQFQMKTTINLRLHIDRASKKRKNKKEKKTHKHWQHFMCKNVSVYCALICAGIL